MEKEALPRRNRTGQRANKPPKPEAARPIEHQRKSGEVKKRPPEGKKSNHFSEGGAARGTLCARTQGSPSYTSSRPAVGEKDVGGTNVRSKLTKEGNRDTTRGGGVLRRFAALGKLPTATLLECVDHAINPRKGVSSQHQIRNPARSPQEGLDPVLSAKGWPQTIVAGGAAKGK